MLVMSTGGDVGAPISSSCCILHGLLLILYFRSGAHPVPAAGRAGRRTTGCAGTLHRHIPNRGGDSQRFPVLPGKMGRPVEAIRPVTLCWPACRLQPGLDGRISVRTIPWQGGAAWG